MGCGICHSDDFMTHSGGHLLMNNVLPELSITNICKKKYTLYSNTCITVFPKIGQLERRGLDRHCLKAVSLLWSTVVLLMV